MRRRHGQLRRGQLERERVLLVDLRIAPARRAIELEHPQRAVVVAQLIDAIFVAVEREQAPGRLQPDAFRSSEHDARVESIERRGCRMRHSHTRHINVKSRALKLCLSIRGISSTCLQTQRSWSPAAPATSAATPCCSCVARGERVVVLDDLSTGFRQAVRDVPLVVGNVGDRELVDSAARRTPASTPSSTSPRTPSCRSRSRIRSSTTATTPARRAPC